MLKPIDLSALPAAEPVPFEQAVAEAVEQLAAAAERFAELTYRVDAEQLTEDEWRIVSEAGEAIRKAVEAAEDGFVAVMYDGHAWRRII